MDVLQFSSLVPRTLGLFTFFCITNSSTLNTLNVYLYSPVRVFLKDKVVTMELVGKGGNIFPSRRFLSRNFAPFCISTISA